MKNCCATDKISISRLQFLLVYIHVEWHRWCRDLSIFWLYHTLEYHIFYVQYDVTRPSPYLGWRWCFLSCRTVDIWLEISHRRSFKKINLRAFNKGKTMFFWCFIEISNGDGGMCLIVLLCYKCYTHRMHKSKDRVLRNCCKYLL